MVSRINFQENIEMSCKDFFKAKEKLLQILILIPFLYVFLLSYFMSNNSKIIVPVSILGLLGLILQRKDEWLEGINYYNLIIFIYAVYIFISYLFRDGSQGVIRTYVSIGLFALLLKPLDIRIRTISIIIFFSSIVLLANLSYYYFVRDEVRMAGIMNIIPYATLCSAIAIIGFANFLESLKDKTNTKSKGVISFVTFLLGSLAVLLSMTRGVWLAQAVAMIAVTIVYFGRHSWKLLTLCFVSIVMIYSFSDFFDRRIEQTVAEVERLKSDDFSGSIGLRLQMWQAAGLLFKEKPLVGQGEGYRDRLSYLYKNDQINESLYRFRVHHFHNQFLDILVRQGLIGFILYLAMILYSISFVLRIGIEKMAGLFGVIIVYIVSGLTDVPMSHSQTIAAYILITTFYIKNYQKLELQ